MEVGGISGSLEEDGCIPWTLNGRTAYSPDPGWREWIFLGTMENAELIFRLYNMCYMAGGGEMDGLGPW